MTTMKSREKRLICLLCVLVVTRLAWAVTTDSAGSTAPAADSSDTSSADAKANDDSDKPYSAIWVRNVFDLKPVPPPKTEPDKTNTPPPTARLIGLFDLAKIRHAIFVETKPPEPGKPSATAETTLMMTEGERRDGIEVLEIDIPGKKAKVKIDEQVFTYNLETNKSAAGGPPGMAAGAGRIPGGGGRIGGGPGTPSGNPGGGYVPPDRPIRGQGANSPVYPQGQNNNYIQPGYAGGSYGGTTAGTTPGLSIPGSAFNQTPTGGQAAPDQAVPAEVTAAILAAQRAAATQAGRVFPPSPPPLDVGGQDSPPGVPAPTGTPAPPPLGQRFSGTPPPGLPR